MPVMCELPSAAATTPCACRLLRIAGTMRSRQFKALLLHQICLVHDFRLDPTTFLPPRPCPRTLSFCSAQRSTSLFSA